jgi:hypothetical protein
MTPPDFNGTAPPDWNENLTLPPDDSSGYGTGDRAMPNFNGTMPDFNGTMPETSGNPGEMDSQPNLQTSGSQTNYTFIATAGIIVVAAVVALIAVVFIHKRKAHNQTASLKVTPP